VPRSLHPSLKEEPLAIVVCIARRAGGQIGVAEGDVHHRKGEEAQVDHGTGPRVRDPKTGKYRRTRLFVLTLGYSRKAVRRLTFQSIARIWETSLHSGWRRSRTGGHPSYRGKLCDCNGSERL